jgi:hypothetical protein
MPTIHIDEQVKAELVRKATSGLTPNDVIRKLLGLPTDELPIQELGVYLIPHSPKEFKNTEVLKRFLREELPKDGIYAFASLHFWKNVIPNSICIFQKDKTIVGEAEMDGGISSYEGTESSPATDKPYAGCVHFIIKSIDVYLKPLSFNDAERLLGKTLTHQGMQRLTRRDYEVIHEACTKH